MLQYSQFKGDFSVSGLEKIILTVYISRKYYKELKCHSQRYESG